MCCHLSTEAMSSEPKAKHNAAAGLQETEIRFTIADTSESEPRYAECSACGDTGLVNDKPCLVCEIQAEASQRHHRSKPPGASHAEAETAVACFASPSGDRSIPSAGG